MANRVDHHLAQANDRKPVRRDMVALEREFVSFATRQDRPSYMSRRFAKILSGRVLDVGCDKAVLRDFVGAADYVGLDRSPEADIHHDLQQGGALPFADDSFDTVVCTDVLEHLDNLHAVFGEILRVGHRHALISLPNNWNAARLRLRRGKGSFKHYGLPLDPPADRHRWFFSFEEARFFFEEQARRHDIQIAELVVLEKPRHLLLRGLRRILYPRFAGYLNLYTHTLVCVYEL